MTHFNNNFQKLTAAVILLLIFIGLLFIFTHIAVFLLILAIPVILAVVIWGVFDIRSGIFLPAVCRFNPLRKQIAVTFDDGPKGEYTLEILEILKAYDAKATFFCTGEMLKKYPEIALKIIEEGHEIGNHSFAHLLNFPFKSSDKIAGEIFRTNELIEKLSGQRALYFRPPFGVSNPNVAKAVKKNGMITVGWSLRSLDTSKRPEKVLRRLRKAKAGDIILMHDNRKQSPKILEEFLRSYQNKSFEFATVSQCIPELLQFKR